MEMLAKKTSGGRWGTPLSASWTEQAYLGQHHCNPLLIVGVSKTANAGSPVSEKNSTRKLADQAHLPTPRYRTPMRAYEFGFPRMSPLGSSVNRDNPSPKTCLF